MKNRFKFDELCKSVTAVSKGISNVPDDAAVLHLNELLAVLNMIDWNEPIIVTSGYRCKELNRLVGGVDTSHHLFGYAADITTGDIEGLKDYVKDNLMEYIDQLIYYPKRRFIHISVHPNKRNMYFVK